MVDKRELFERARSLWPDAVTIGSEAASLDALNNVYWPLEERLSRDSDDWTQLAAWAFHQALAELAGSRPSAGLAALRPNDIAFEAFDRWMRSNLSDESWAKVRAEYDANL